MNIKSKNSFLITLAAFWFVSFMIFSPMANVLFLAPSSTKAAVENFFISDANDAAAAPGGISEGLTLGAGRVICYAEEVLGELWGKAKALLWSILSIKPAITTGDKGAEVAGGTKAMTRSVCASSRGTWLKNKISEAIKAAAITALHNLLAQLTNQIIACINSYDPKTGECTSGGKSGLVLDWNAMLYDAANVAGAKFLNSLTDVNLCSVVPKVSLQIALLPTPSYKTRAECTLDKIVGNIEEFYTDFSKGGWVAWEESLKPNNNAFGSFLIAREQKLTLEYAARMKKEKETTNGFKSIKKCIDPAGVDPDSKECSLAITTTPSGTVETTVNFAALSPVRTLENLYTGFYAQHAGSYGIYLTAISNALLNKMTTTGLQALMETVSASDLQSPNPYQSIINQVSQDSDNFGVAQKNQANINLIITLSQELNKHIADIAKPLYADLVVIANEIRILQDKVINEFWARGAFGTATVTTILGPTVVGNSTITTYKVSHPQIGEATVEKRVSTQDFTDLTTYGLLNKKNRIEDIDGLITEHTTTLNSLSYTQSQINAATGPAQNAYDKITAYIETWDGTSGNAAAKTEMDKAVADAIPFIQKIIPSNSVSLDSLSSEISEFYDQTIDDTMREASNQANDVYDDYLDDVQRIYNNLFSPEITT